ncbi:MAG: DUF438 domain-containing protein [Nitrososphaerota archaeon]|nr:DUF438 domain-containing protein [Nitrososphaerota archaeon]
MRGRLTEEDRKKALKEIIGLIHAGVPPNQVKDRFMQFLESVSPLEIAKIEQEIVSEGISREDIQKLCDLHLEVFREQLEKQKLDAIPESPIGILIEEHMMLQKITRNLKSSAEML